MSLIDPPSVFSPLSEWVQFRKEMQRLVASNPDDEDAAEYLAIAKAKEAGLQG